MRAEHNEVKKSKGGQNAAREIPLEVAVKLDCNDIKFSRQILREHSRQMNHHVRAREG